MSDENEDAEIGKKMPLFDHLVELRRRLTWTIVVLFVVFIICFVFFANDIFEFLVQPLAHVLAKYSDTPHRMIFTALQEKFLVNIKVSLFASLFITFPFIAIQFWLFVAPGLYKRERRALAPYLVATPILFFMGGALVYYFIFPLAWKFFLSFEQSGAHGGIPIQLEAKVDQYLSLVMQLIFAFGLCFQLPVLLTLLARVGLIGSAGLKAKRKYAIVVAFVMAAVLTPPDVISQIGLAVPILLLYEVSIFAVKMVERGRAKEAEDEQGDDDGGSGDSDKDEPETEPAE